MSAANNPQGINPQAFNPHAIDPAAPTLEQGQGIPASTPLLLLPVHIQTRFMDAGNTSTPAALAVGQPPAPSSGCAFFPTRSPSIRTSPN